ncbi:MAG: 5'/3'-nucleotidase SurE [Phycisphaeraceae bacterium]|nr:5'/3'-nucleotidase SurE [Phycisphaeraceae bacterium]MCB9848688.1 5'/3'-nucleotidase SurE [Phycisphaeraceae bacterium]
MKILLTNDDGIDAPGIEAMHAAITDRDGVFGAPLGEPILPVAPLTVQSATSHGLTFHTPLMVSERRVSAHMSGLAVDGRPADCVKLAIANLWPDRFGPGDRPDLVISGMNAGANCGVNIIYSGTVAAAIEAAFLGVPSIAVSLHIGKSKPDFIAAARHARRAIEAALASGDGAPLRRHGCLNINIPVTEGDGPMPPMVVCPMNCHGLVDKYDPRRSPSGDPYYWAAGDGLDFHGSDKGADVDELFRRHITITPLSYDMTHHADLELWRERLAGVTSA